MSNSGTAAVNSGASGVAEIASSPATADTNASINANSSADAEAQARANAEMLVNFNATSMEQNDIINQPEFPDEEEPTLDLPPAVQTTAQVEAKPRTFPAAQRSIKKQDQGIT